MSPRHAVPSRRKTIDTQAVKILKTKYPAKVGARAEPTEKTMNKKAAMTMICSVLY